MQFRRRVLGSELRPEPDASMWSTSRLASSLPAIHDGPLLARSFRGRYPVAAEAI